MGPRINFGENLRKEPRVAPRGERAGRWAVRPATERSASGARREEQPPVMGGCGVAASRTLEGRDRMPRARAPLPGAGPYEVVRCGSAPSLLHALGRSPAVTVPGRSA